MLINVQMPDAAMLLNEMIEVVQPELKGKFMSRVDAKVSCFEHPCCSDGAVLVTPSGDDTL